mmetsp:Transcript_5302/g.7980  ORF Transcript_5302/g.7980 Transcript_5302/m.7980 type:complete len:264 (-) Transcript_5302:73-864(-)
MLAITYLNHPRANFLEVEGNEEETKRNMKWFFEQIFDYFHESHEIWALEDPDTRSITAVALIEPPHNPPAKLSMGPMLTSKAVMQLGSVGAYSMSSYLNTEFNFRTEQIDDGEGVLVIHYVGSESEDITSTSAAHELISILVKHSAKNHQQSPQQELPPIPPIPPQSFFSSFLFPPPPPTQQPSSPASPTSPSDSKLTSFPVALSSTDQSPSSVFQSVCTPVYVQEYAKSHKKWKEFWVGCGLGEKEPWDDPPMQVFWQDTTW